MSFATLQVRAAELRSALVSFVGPKALVEVTVAVPRGDRDELSFVRLIAWAYALLFESGRIAFPFLTALPSGTAGDPKALREKMILTQELRTWSFHNLGLDRERDVDILKRVQRWFLKTCGRTFPASEEEWSPCFAALCAELSALIEHCHGAISLVLGSEEDGGPTVLAFRQRLDRDWPAHTFDTLAGDVIARFGLKFDAVKVRQGRLSEWRRVLQTLSPEIDAEAEITRLIERDVLDSVRGVLPISGRDVMQSLGLSPGPEVKQALERARVIFSTEQLERDALLARLQSEGIGALPARDEAKEAQG